MDSCRLNVMIVLVKISLEEIREILSMFSKKKKPSISLNHAYYKFKIHLILSHMIF